MTKIRETSDTRLFRVFNAYRAMVNENSINILKALEKHGEMNELEIHLGTSIPEVTIGSRLRTLLDAKLVKYRIERKDRKYVKFYKLDLETYRKMCNFAETF